MSERGGRDNATCKTLDNTRNDQCKGREGTPGQARAGARNNLDETSLEFGGDFGYSETGEFTAEGGPEGDVRIRGACVV